MEGRRLGFVHLLQARMPLHFPHFVFDLHSEVAGDAAKISHGLAKSARDLGQFLRSEHNQGNEENDDQMGNAEHVMAMNPNPDSKRPSG